ncbi:hypothetical protein [Pseudorhodobacter sp.]|uniref:phage tail terminator protein n=1 Tax=Pseudorhodobacter sp. TaxID=1934400 RepID=UPI00264A08CD|nr:hypothetical protein [Pseudorhodobacter sp.]MDN5786394.1 hypothetical protein [Pseudorhodobacter sp.]
MLALIHDRLSAVLPQPPFSGVEIAEDIDALASRAGLVESGTVILMPWKERAGPQMLATGGHRQKVETQFAVGIVIRHYDQLMGGERAVQFDSFKTSVEAALAGWEPADASPCELIGGESSPISTGVSIYVQTWTTTRFLTGA